MKKKDRRINFHFNWNLLFCNTKFVICFSVLLSIALWGALAMNDTEERPRAISDVPIKITLSNAAQADGMKVFSQSNTTATVSIKGNSVTVPQMKPTDLVVTAPAAANITSPGTYTLPLSVQNSEQNLNLNQYTLDHISPQQIWITVDRFREKTFGIQNGISYKAGYQSNSAYFVGAPTFSTESISISGPEKQVTQVNKVSFEYTIDSTLTETKKFTASLVLYDANGNKIDKSNMTVTPDKVDVTIPVMPRQTLKLEPTLTGKPAGLTLNAGQLQVTPGTLEIAGPKDTLATMAGKLSLDPIDFSQISPSHNSFDVNVTLPSTCKNLSNVPTARVTMDLAGLTTKTMETSTFNVKNLSADKKAVVNTSGLTVTVVGPQAEVEKLTSANVVGSVDLSGKENFTGQTEIPTTFSVTGSTRCWVYGSYMITVDVTQKAS